VVLNIFFYVRRAARRNRHAMVAAQLHKATVQSQQTFSLLRNAARNGNVPVFQAALESTDPAHRRGHVNVALDDAVLNGKLEAIRYAYESPHASEIAPTPTDATRLLSYATSNVHADIARYMMERGADVNCNEGRSWTPLHWCAQHPEPGAVIIARCLLEHGAHVDARIAERVSAIDEVYNRFGYTPLMLAARDCNFDMMRLLLKHHANPRLKTPDGETASSLVAHYVLRNTVDTLLYPSFRGGLH
jgi:ankyrin repeat protein